MEKLFSGRINNQKRGTRCKTEYPILLVHGAGFRDDNIFYNYWGRIPKALIEEGAEVFYAGTDAWGEIIEAANVVKKSVFNVIEKTGAEKVNLICHSKGGMESRYMISKLGMADYISSMTTISTLHHGSKTIELLIYNIPVPLYKFASFFVNLYFKLLGDKKPDFFNATRQMTKTFCKKFNRDVPDIPGIYYQSYACKMKNPFSAAMFFLLNLVIKIVEGDNDGLVPVNAAHWGKFKGIITGKRLRGVSHADAVDLWRMNFSGIDMREIYMGIVEELKDMGM